MPEPGKLPSMLTHTLQSLENSGLRLLERQARGALWHSSGPCNEGMGLAMTTQRGSKYKPEERV